MGKKELFKNKKIILTVGGIMALLFINTLHFYYFIIDY